MAASTGWVHSQYRPPSLVEIKPIKSNYYRTHVIVVYISCDLIIADDIFNFSRMKREALPLVVSFFAICLLYSFEFSIDFYALDILVI